MPSESRPREQGAESLYAARVRAAVAPMHAEPRITSAQVSQQLAGHLVDVIGQEEGWARIRGSDDYTGWTYNGYLARIPPLSSRESGRAAPISLGCTTEDIDGARRALPLRALLSPGERAVEGEAIDPGQLSIRFPLEAKAIAATARRYFCGTSYQWGGVTPWGADCSGLVQAVYALHGRQLPRDSWQQAEQGRTVKDAFSNAYPGDLWFFSERDDRRITHVGIALAPNQMVHLSLARGGYAIDRLDNDQDSFVATLRDRFVVGKRLL